MAAAYCAKCDKVTNQEHRTVDTYRHSPGSATGQVYRKDIYECEVCAAARRDEENGEESDDCQQPLPATAGRVPNQEGTLFPNHNSLKREGRIMSTKLTDAERAAIESEIDALKKIEVCVETNEGTFGPRDAHRCCGTGDPMFATRRVYETVGGARRETGPSEDRAPGRMRTGGYEPLSVYRARLAELQSLLY